MTAPCRSRTAGGGQNVGRLRGSAPEDARELGEAMRGVRQEAAGMREDDAGSGIPVHDAVQHELDSGSSGVERVVDERAWDAGRRRKRWLPGMDEHDGVAAGELRPEWRDRRLAAVVP